MSLLSGIFGSRNGQPGPAGRPCAGLYIDIENLREDAKALLGALVDSWPSSFPRPGLITFYVQADQAELWRMWALSKFKGAQVRVRGTQRFSGHLSKNSADIAIATDAIADFVRERVDHVAVFSDDSDFMSLYVKIREEAGGKGPTPFLWILTDRRGTKSFNIRRYFPSEHIFVVRSGGQHARGTRSGTAQAPSPSQPPRSREPSREPRPERTRETRPDPAADRAIAEAIVERMPVGYFKSTDCQSIVREMYPNHPLAHASSGAMGQRFVKSLLPLLMELGVTEPNTNRRPRRFQITEEAKRRSQSRRAAAVK